MENYRPKKEILLDQKLRTQMIMIKNEKSNLVLMISLKKTIEFCEMVTVASAVSNEGKKMLL